MDYQAIHNPAYFGRGRVRFGAPMRPLEPDGVDHLAPGRFLGNAKTLAIEPQLTAVDTSAWDDRSNLVLHGMTARLELYGHGGDNLSAALSGARVQSVGTTLNETVHVGHLSLPADSMLYTRHMIDATRPISVVPSWTSWVEGVHWERCAFGVRLMAGFSGPVSGSIDLAYTCAGGAEEVSAATVQAAELSLVYSGWNRADGTAMRLECYRCRSALDGGLSVISEAAGLIALSINILPVRIAPGVTRWYRTMRAPFIAGHYVQ